MVVTEDGDDVDCGLEGGHEVWSGSKRSHRWMLEDPLMDWRREVRG